MPQLPLRRHSWKRCLVVHLFGEVTSFRAPAQMVTATTTKSSPMSGIVSLICLACLLSCPLSELIASERATKRTEFGVGPETASALEELPDGSCIFFRVFFMSESIFQDLKRTDTKDGSKFKKGGKPIDSFPRHFVVNVEANVYKCKKDNPVQQAPLDFKSDFMRSMTFRLQWKSALELRPAESVLTSTRGPTSHLFANRWEYFLEVSAKDDIPLSDSLIIDIQDASGLTIRRVSGRL